MMEPLDSLLNTHREYFYSGRTREIGFRTAQLEKLRDCISAHQDQLVQAMYQDLHKPARESYATEIGFCLAEIDYILKHLRFWSRTVQARGPILFPQSKTYVQYEPFGVALIISPWNYPFQLTISPLVGALSAGNCAVLKPSELSSNTAVAIDNLINDCFEPGYVSVVQGDAAVAQRLLQQKFDYIFYTGGGVVGKSVMKAAAEHLTPVTLELGGKCPCIVDSDIDLEKAVKRIAWGKFMNAGQTCNAPDYLLVQRDVKNSVVEGLKKSIMEFYGPDIKASQDYGRIINRRHFDRIISYLMDGEVIYGGQSDAESLYIVPTLMENVRAESRLMQEEIFGPILPVLEYSVLDEAIRFINSRPKPLALYLFSNDREVQKKVLRETSSGGVCINDTVVQIAYLQLPFGGVGDSGFGKYHAKHSFDLFSNRKGIMLQTVEQDLAIRYPPYNSGG
ncbi:MAG: aldehyde dehydrogenase [Dehalococcoidia bacterium]